MNNPFYKIITLLTEIVELMKNLVKQLVQTVALLRKIVTLLGLILSLEKANLAHSEFKEDPLPQFYSKKEVMDILKISESTYKRYVRNGYLTPFGFHGIDLFVKRNFIKGLLESKRKGRL